jgi:hypothetical protein
MRHGLTIVPAGMVLVVALLGAGGGAENPPTNGVAWQDEYFGMPIAPIWLLVRPDVQRDLQLNPRQIAGARDLLARLLERGLSAKKKPPDAARAEKLAIDEEMAAWFRHELAPAQVERLTQINFQWEGASALRRTVVAEYLVLGDPQRFRIEHLLSERDKKRAGRILAPGEFDKLSRQALDVLTPIQTEQWKELLGPPCRFAIGHPAGPPRNAAAAPGVKGQPRPSGR